MKVALVTYRDLPALSSDDQLLLDALCNRGIEAIPAVWDDASVDWALIDVCVLRSTWDYHLRQDEFIAWVRRVTPLTAIWNGAEAIEWNSHKSYLRDLSDRGVPIVPTTWIEQGTPADLRTLITLREWDRVVIKPAVSASAHETILVGRADVEEGQQHLDRLLPTRDMLVQPFLPSVEEYGERSLIYINGELTHAVSRPPVLGNSASRGEPNTLVEPASDELELTRRTLQAATFPTLYARIDIVRDTHDKACLMELELIEPSLWLSLAPQAVDRFVQAISARAAS